MDYSPPGPSIHGIFQARVLEWIAIAFSFYLLISHKFTYAFSSLLPSFVNVTLMACLGDCNSLSDLPASRTGSLLPLHPHSLVTLYTAATVTILKGKPGHAISLPKIL